MILKNQIIEWLKKQPYWLQFSGNLILEGQKIDDAFLEATLNYFKEENCLKKQETEQNPIEYKEIESIETSITDDVQLVSISDIENVNALISGQEIEINKNLTIIYGNNGSGKSGYIRLLNNAFYNSRGDKNILSNVFSDESSGEPSCKFIFKSNDNNYDKFYPEDNNCFEFSRYSVFDTQSVKIHLDNDNQLNFTPIGFDFFEKVLQLFEELKSRIIKEISNAKKDNSFLIHFQNDNEIKLLIESLGAQTDIEKLKKAGEFSEQDAEKIEELNKKINSLKSLNIQEQISAFEKLHRELLDFIKRQQVILNSLTKEKIDYALSLIDSFHKTQTLVNAEGIKSLEKYSIESVGSQPWRDFIVAAQRYKTEFEKNSQKKYPKEGDRCLFCLQPITSTEKTLIETYWTLLQSKVEGELKRLKQEVKNTVDELKNLQTVVFDESTNLYTFLNKHYSQHAKKWQQIVIDSEKSIKNLIKNLENLNKELPVDFCLANTEELTPILHKIKNHIDELFKKKPDQEIEKLTIQLNYLKDKSLLTKLMPQVLDYVSAYKWAATAEKSLNAFRTNSLTTLQGHLFNQHITKKYTNIFDEECKFLKAPRFVEISQQNSKLKTLRKLSIANKQASQVLSEGEQRAISLADFLTEVQLNPQNRGVVFDDPVSSLDHERRALIAERLVKLAKTKQVILFTHDISFFAKLTHIAKLLDISASLTTIRKIGDTVGIVKPDLPWVAQKIKDRIKYLRNLLVRLQKLEKEGKEDEYSFQVKAWYGLLREAWERCVEERLFKGVIERFSGEVHTKQLENIEIKDEYIQLINEGMTQASNWVHDQAMGLNPPIPDSGKAEKDFELLTEFAEKCKNQ